MARDLNDLTKPEYEKHQKKFGRFNDYPPNWQECNSSEFWYKFMGYSPWLEEYRQMRSSPNMPLKAARLYFYGAGEGLAMVENYDRKAYNHLTPKLYKFYLCDHNYVRVDDECRMHTHVSYCSKCGVRKEIDSSG